MLHFGFTPSEVSITDTARLRTWSPLPRGCSSPKAAANAQKRLLRHLSLSPLPSAHRLWKVKVMRTNKAMTTTRRTVPQHSFLKALLARPTERNPHGGLHCGEHEAIRQAPVGRRASDIRVDYF